MLHPPPTLLEPSEGATFPSGTSIRFDWSDEGPGNEFQVAKSANFNNPVVEQFIFGTSEYTTSSLPAGKLYWRVRAYDDAFNPGDWSAVRTLTVSS